MAAWALPKFGYGQRVKLLPLADPDGKPAAGRVIDLHFIGMGGVVEYDCRWFHEGKDFRARFFEDELEPE